MINVADIKINMHRQHANRPWFAKIYQIKTIFVCEPYLKTTELGYQLIALNTQKYGKLNGKQKLRVFPKTKISTEKKFLFASFTKKNV